MLANFMHWMSKRLIRKRILKYSKMSIEQRVYLSFYVWLIRGVNLSEISGYKGINTPVYYYKKGAEVALGKLEDIFIQINHNGLVYAVGHHYSTNLAGSYSDRGYTEIVKLMWEKLIEGIEGRHYLLISSDYSCFSEKDFFLEVINNNDITIEEFFKDPKKIIPHFLVEGHPLTEKLIQLELIAKKALG